MGLESLTLGEVADWVGIVGFLLTIRVWWVTRGLSKVFLNRARIPEIRGDLTKLSSELLKAIQTRGPDDIGNIYSRIESSLDAAAGKVSFWRRGSLKDLRIKVKGLRQSGAFSIEEVKPVYDELLGVVEMLRNIEKDVAWGVVK